MRLCDQMLELILAFGAGAAASSWLHYKARKTIKAKPPGTSAGASAISPSPSPQDRRPLTGASRAALLILTLAPEVSAQLFNQMAPEDVQRVTLEITQAPTLSPLVREQVVAEFCSSVGIAPDRLQEAAREEPALIAKALVLLTHLPAAS